MSGNIAQLTAMASIRASVNVFLCGAFIIHNSWLLTAAQCVFERFPNNTIVSSGSNALNPTIIHSVTPGTEANPRGGIVVHNEFGFPHMRNDIALIRVTTPIVFNAATSLIPIDFGLIGSGIVDVEIFGWGRTAANGGLQASLRSAVFRVVPFLTTCWEVFPIQLRNYITENHFCASWAARATCPGDEGGPVIFEGRVVGIASWVQPCAAGQTNVNTRMSSYQDWIWRNVGPMVFDEITKA